MTNILIIFANTKRISDLSSMVNKTREYIKPKAKQPHQGAIYVVTGSAAKVGSGPLDHPAHYIGLIGAGSMVIDINENKLIARFINHRGQVRDTFSIRKDDQYVSSVTLSPGRYGLPVS
jgi:hypothetical protein